jgi:hypothetical protein
MSRFHDPAGALRPATLSIAGVAIAVVAVVAISLNPGRAAADPGASASAAPSVPAASAAAPSAPDPTSVPAPDPTPVSTPVSTPVVSPEPTAPPADDPGSDAMPIAVELDTFDGHAVSIDVVDRTGTVVAAVSGRPGDNPSADGLAVVNVDDHTLQLTWVDFPIDNRLALFVDDAGGHLRLLLIQPGPTVVTDAIGFDRQLVLTFDRPVDASTVEGIIQEGMDT